LRDIFPNEEITISYGAITKPVTERRQIIKAKLGWLCVCDTCVDADSSKTNRDEDRRVHNALERYFTPFEREAGLDFHVIRYSSEALLEYLNEARKLYLEAGICDARIFKVMEYGYVVAAYHGDGGRASIFAQEAYNWLMDREGHEELGNTSYDTTVWKKLFQDPTLWESSEPFQPGRHPWRIARSLTRFVTKLSTKGCS